MIDTIEKKCFVKYSEGFGNTFVKKVIKDVYF